MFSSPAFITTLFGLLGGLVTFFGTNGLKLSSSWLKGRKTQLVAGLISALTAGVGGYFGLAETTGVNGIEGALLAALSTLGALGIAVGAHEKNRYQETGLRKPERKAGIAIADTALKNLIYAGKMLPPPFNLAAGAVKEIYDKHGYEYVKNLIDARRALTEQELAAAGDAWEKKQTEKVTNPVVTTAATK